MKKIFSIKPIFIIALIAFISVILKCGYDPLSLSKYVSNRHIPFSISKYISQGHRAKNVNSNLVLVNRKNTLSSDYVPKDLVKVNARIYPNTSPEEQLMRKEAAKALERLFKAAKEDGIRLYVLSGYRSFNLQKEIYDERVRTRGEDYANSYVAIPGTSEHQTGLAMDIANKQHNFQNSKEERWLKRNAFKFGFIIRYPIEKEKITGYNYEPWHVRYVGKKVSIKMHSQNIVLEEYLKG